ncbi:hypothetical protein EXIGLDRAFT_829000 [Exidia glandulosa HHB12029]|uniref:Ubiquitin-like domain-containing protein n=1 Tax=Exidia glandulosa HHB12029 TaxID=1314781 RepID=A0A165PZH1_EXIGL|nr:hypothetical protein EXIGLDRAFT_829000 [Exidia glandulosa HHB12029]
MTIPVTANAVGDIIALVQLGLGAVQRLSNARGAKAEYREIQSRLESLQSLLELCEASVNSISDPDHKSTVTAHIVHARTQLATALQLLPGYKRLATASGTLASPVSTLHSIRSRVRDASKSLSWELRQSANARACLGKLSESIQTIHLAITAAHSADTNIHFRSMSSTITSATAVTIAMQTDMSMTRSLVESMDARLSSVHDAVSSRVARGSELQATLRQTFVDEMTGLHEELSLQTRQTQQYHRRAAVAVDGLAQQLADIQMAVDALNCAHQRPAVLSSASTLDRFVSLRRVSLSATTLVQISRAVVPSNELFSGGCIGSLLVLAASAPRMTDQAAYLFCACLLFIAARMHRIYKSPVVVHVVVIIDLFGDQIQLPIHEARSAEQVHVALLRQFQPGRMGCNLTRSRMYDLAFSDDESAVGHSLPDVWTNLLQPGQKLVMNARIQAIGDLHNTELACPVCHVLAPQPATCGRWIKCSRCPARFESSSTKVAKNFTSIGRDTNRHRPSYPRRQTQNAESEFPHSDSLAPIVRELALCKRIRILSLKISREHEATVAHENGLRVDGECPPSPVEEPPEPPAEERRLNVADALTYLDMVKCHDDPQIYDNFIDIMKQFKSEQINTLGVIELLAVLFDGHPQLIHEFNNFLPQGYRIECSIYMSSVTVITTPTGTRIQAPPRPAIPAAI